MATVAAIANHSAHREVAAITARLALQVPSARGKAKGQSSNAWQRAAGALWERSHNSRLHKSGLRGNI